MFVFLLLFVYALWKRLTMNLQRAGSRWRDGEYFCAIMISYWFEIFGHYHMNPI